MSKELLLVIETLSNEKAIPKEKLYSALEEALAGVKKRKLHPSAQVVVKIDRKTGEISAFRRFKVVEAVRSAEEELALSEVQGLEKEVTLGDYIEQPTESIAVDRIATQAAKQAIFAKVREAEREALADRFQSKIGHLLAGIILKVTPEGWFLDMSEGVEGFLARQQAIAKESFRVGDRVRTILKSIQPQGYGPVLQLSRVATEMLTELLHIEVPEIGEGVIAIKAVARDPGSRAKVAVKALDRRVDPVGACVGMRGSRIQAISSELHGERIDVILWDDNYVQYVVNAMAPAEVRSIVLDEEEAKMDIAVEHSTLAQAIGRNGQNVRLASQLTGWQLNIMTESQLAEKAEKEQQVLHQLIQSHCEDGDSIETQLESEGIFDTSSLAALPVENLSAITGLSEKEAQRLSEAAAQTASALSLQNETKRRLLSMGAPVSSASDHLETLNALLAQFETSPGQDDLTQLCKENEITSLTALADSSVNDFDLPSQTLSEALGKAIMAARTACGWFNDNATS